MALAKSKSTLTVPGVGENVGERAREQQEDRKATSEFNKGLVAEGASYDPNTQVVDPSGYYAAKQRYAQYLKDYADYQNNIAKNAKITLDKDTGKITVHAPTAAVKSKAFRDSIDPALKAISQNYKLNKDYKYALMADSDETKTSEEWIDDLNTDFSDIVAGAIARESERKRVKDETGIDMSDEDIIKMHSLALEYNDLDGNTVNVKDSTVQSLPEKVKNLNAFKDLEGWDKNTHAVEWGNLKKVWDRSKISDDDIHEVFDVVDEYFEAGDFSNVSEYAEMTAFREFLRRKDPETTFLRGVVETGSEVILGTLDGVVASTLVDIASLGETILNIPADGKLGLVKNELEPWYENLKKEHAENIAEVNDAASTAFKASSAVGEVVSLVLPAIGLGKVAAKLATKAPKVLLKAIERYGAPAKELAKIQASTVAAGAVDYKNLAKALYVSADLILRLSKPSRAAEIMAKGIKTVMANATAMGIGARVADTLGQAIVDITLSDRKMFRTLMSSDNAEAKTWAMRQLAINAAAEVTGVGAGRAITNFGSSDLALVMQAKSVPYISGIKAQIGQTADNLKTIIHGGDEDWLLTRTNKLREASDRSTGKWYSKAMFNIAGSSERKLQNLAERRILRRANEEIGDLAGTVRGDTWEETLEAARRVKGEMADKLATAQNLINTVYRRDVTVLVKRFIEDNADLASMEKNYLRALDKVIKEEDALGLGKARKRLELRGEGKGKQTYSIISEETNAYIIGQYRIKRAEATIKLSGNAEDVKGAKSELEYWTEVVKAFRENNPASMVEAADELLVAGKNFSASVQDLRVKEGVMQRDRLEALRESGFFDDGYLRIQREKSWASYRERGGKLSLSELRDEQQYKWGDTDPFQDISIVLFDDLNEVARQVNRKRMVNMLRGVGFKVDTVVDGKTTKVVSDVNRVKTDAIKDIQQSTDKSVANTTARIYDAFFEKKKGQFFVDTAEAKEISSAAKLNRAERKAYKVGRKDRHELFSRYLNDGEIDSLIVSDPRSAFNIAVIDEESFRNFYKALDRKTKSWLNSKFKEGVGHLYEVPLKTKKGAKRLNITPRTARELREAMGIEEKIMAKDVATFDTLRALSEYDPEFTSQLKRVYAEANFNDIYDDLILEAKHHQAVNSAQNLYKENIDNFEKMKQKYNIPELNARVDEQVDVLIDDVVSANTQNAEVSQAVTALADEATTGDDLIEYVTLQSLNKNMSKVKKDFYVRAKKDFNEALTENMRKKYGNDKALLKKKLATAKRMSDEWANEATKVFETRLDERYGQIANKLMEQSSPLVTEEARKDIFRHIAQLNKEIKGASSTPNIIKTYDAFGREEYVEISPTVADMFTSMPREIRRGPFGELQASFVRLFRFGTTGGLVPGSLVSQGFRDTGNAVVVGDAMKTNARIERELADLFGERFAEEYQRTIPDVWQTLLKKSEETGEDVNRLIAQREMKLGAENVSRELEANIYQLGREAKMLRREKGIYDRNRLEQAVDNIDEFQKKAEKLNTMRETYLRERVYNNNLLKGMKEGLSVQQAREVAEFMQAEATTNFVRQSYYLSNLSKTVPYLSAAINGAKSFWRLASWDPIGITTRIIGGYVVPVIALTNMSLADEENRRIYKQIPEYEKAENIVFVLDGQILSIPVPQEIASFVAPVQHMIETIQGEGGSDFSELLANDLLGAMPVDLSGFINIDSDKLLGDNLWENHLMPGFAKVSATLMPPLVKSGFIWATGVDPYTMKTVSRNNITIDGETGEQTVMDYTAGSLAMTIGAVAGDFMSAGMAQKLLSNLIGQGNLLIADSLVSMASAVADPEKSFLRDGAGKVVESYLTNAGKRLTVSRYGEESNKAWNRAVATLWEEKKALLTEDKQYVADVEALSRSDLSDAARKEIQSRVNTKRQAFMQRVLNASNNLISRYDGTFDRNKFGAVLSLMNMDSENVNENPTNSWSTYLSKQDWSINRAAALETMRNMGFSGPNDGSIFGYYGEDDDGNITVQYSTPLSILNFEEAASHQDEIAFADVNQILNEKNMYERKQSIKKQLDAIYGKKKLSKQDYAKIEQIQINWNAEVAAEIAPIVARLTPEAAINNTRVKNLLRQYIYVPSSYGTNNRGRYVSLGDKGSRTDAYYESWIKSMFSVNDKYKGQY